MRSKFNNLQLNIVYIFYQPIYLKKKEDIFLVNLKFYQHDYLYNKSDEHKIIYYQPCVTESNMNLVEKFI
jgi:hypothetical protein